MTAGAHDPPHRRAARITVFGAFFLFAPLAIAEAAAGSCSPTEFDADARIARVPDGDTVVLDDGAYVRLIGVDTPELARHLRPPQPGAEIARDFLAELLPSGTAVRMDFDIERADRHGRTLAHLFLQDGGNVQERILAAGLGTPLTVPPNLGFLDCYRGAAAAAMAAKLGVWRLRQYRPLPAAEIPESARGYRAVRGRVTRRAESAESLWLEIDGRVALRVERTDLPWFRGFDLRNVAGAVLEARGMIYRRNGQLRMRIRHPADLLGLSPDPGTATTEPGSEEVFQ